MSNKHFSKRISPFIGTKRIIVLAVAIISGFWAKNNIIVHHSGGQVSNNQSYYDVKRVVDGDTIWLENGEKIRLVGMDAPESRENDKALRDSHRTGADLDSIVKMGKKATAFVRELVDRAGNKVKLEYEVEPKDKYGRSLAYLFIKIPGATPATDPNLYFMPNSDEIFLNASIVKSGYASPMTIPPNVKYSHLIVDLFRDARKNNRGLWGEQDNLLFGKR
ncbi:MAG: thermonuclease family protein [Candidatus Omnitrophica bacterium]|nr:thermonuclease family protein [Candidatus Omnitrophota bacterium]